MKFRSALLLAGLLPVAAIANDEAGRCSAYMMDVSAELELFSHAASSVQAGGTVPAAPSLQTSTLYAVQLPLQEGVRYPATLARRPIEPQKHGGMVRLKFTEAGQYRVAIDANVWIDAVHEGVPLESVDFRSDRECKGGPTKIVTFAVPAEAEVVVQFIDVDRTAVRLVVTPAPQAVW